MISASNLYVLVSGSQACALLAEESIAKEERTFGTCSFFHQGDWFQQSHAKYLIKMGQIFGLLAKIAEDGAFLSKKEPLCSDRLWSDA